MIICFWRLKNTSFRCINSEFWSKILGLIISYSYIGQEFEGKYVFTGSGWLCADQRYMVHIEQRKQNPSKLASLHSLFFLRVGLCVYKWKNWCTSHSCCCCCWTLSSILFFVEVWYPFHFGKKNVLKKKKITKHSHSYQNSSTYLFWKINCFSEQVCLTSLMVNAVLPSWISP